MTIIRKSTLRKIESIAAITAYIATIGEFTIKSVADELEISKENARRYINEMRECGAVSVIQESYNHGKTIQPAVYMAGIHASAVVQCDDDCEPVIPHITQWAHGSATRYRMGRMVAA